MKLISDFYSRLIPFVPGCPEPTVNQAFVDAAIAFCEDSLVLREGLDTFQTVPGTSQYGLFAPSSHSQVARVLHVVVDGWPVELVPSERVVTMQPMSGTPRIAYTTRDGSEYTLNLYPTPDRAVDVRVSVALRPTRAATQFDDELFDHWSEAVVAGALSRLMSIPNQAFSDPQGAAMQMSRAMQLSNKAKVEGSYGRVRGQLQTRMRPFA